MDHDELRKRIAERAYFYFVARGKTHGHDEEDWLRAEAEVMAEITPKKTARKKPAVKKRSTTRTKTRRKARTSPRS